MVFDWKKIGIWGGAITALGVVGYWLYQYQQTAAANNAAQAAQDSQDQNQALEALLASPSGTSSETASVSGPSVDTGNDALQTLINSILNPSTGTVSATPNPVTTTPSLPAQPQPVGGGGNPVTVSMPSPTIPNGVNPSLNPGSLGPGDIGGANPLPVSFSPGNAKIEPAMLTTMVQ